MKLEFTFRTSVSVDLATNYHIRRWLQHHSQSIQKHRLNIHVQFLGHFYSYPQLNIHVLLSWQIGPTTRHGLQVVIRIQFTDIIYRPCVCIEHIQVHECGYEPL